MVSNVLDNELLIGMDNCLCYLIRNRDYKLYFIRVQGPQSGMIIHAIIQSMISFHLSFFVIFRYSGCGNWERE